MKTCVLASGSKGNVTYIETKFYKILIDVGKNCKYIKDALTEINIDLKSIDLVLISHLHNDHISGLFTVINKCHPFLCLTKPMLKELPQLKDYDKLLIYDDNIYLDNLKIVSIKSSHDVSDSRNFLFEENNNSVVYITDTGYLKAKYFDLLKDKEVYLMESNHDTEMLINGPYPKWLKKRVLSDYGHLSNNAASFYLTKLIGPHTKKVVLMHLSEVNNTPLMSLNTLQDTFKEYDIDFNDVLISKQNKRSDVINI